MTELPTTPAATNPARQQMLYDVGRKSTGVAYLLWIFLGGIGGHRFYLGKTGTAFAQIGLLVFGWLTVLIGIGFLLLGALGIWVIADAFMIPGITRDHNLRLADRLTGD